MWFNDFLKIYKSGISHQFLLHFNIRDIADNYRSINRYLYEEFIRPRGFGIVAFYDISRGLSFLEPAMEKEFNKIIAPLALISGSVLPSKLFTHIDKALKGTKMALFIDHVEKIVPAGDLGTMSLEERMALIWICEWSMDSKISSAGSAIFMLSDNIAAVSKEVTKSSYRVEPIFVELPNEDERKKYIEHLLSDNQVKMSISIDEFAKLSSGLNKKGIQDMRLKAEAEGVPISFEFIKEKKHSVLKKEYGDVLEFIYPEIGFQDIGGMDEAKDYLIQNVVGPIKSGDLRRVPMGILLCGPSGTGKTLLVNALAKSSGFNCVKLDMSRILGQL